MDRLKKNQFEETWMKPLILFLRDKAIPTDSKVVRFVQKNVHKYIVDQDNILKRIIKISRPLRRLNEVDKFVICIPYNMCSDVLFECHDSIYSGHLGRTKTWERVREKYYWPGMYEDIKTYVKTCEECMRFKGERNFKLGKRQRMPIESLCGPFDFIVADAIGPLPKTKFKNKYIITITDYFTRWAEAIPVADLKSSTWLKVVRNEVFCRHGVTKRLLTDQGGNFTSLLAQCFYQIVGVKKLTSTGYHPETQGLDERFNGTIIKILKMYVNRHQDDWDETLPVVLFAYRTAYHETIKDTPFYLLYGRDARMPGDIKFLESKVTLKSTNLNFYRRKIVFEILESRSLVYEELKRVQDKILNSNVNDKRKEIYFEIGEPVWLYSYFRKLSEDDSRISKLATKWHGPYRICGQISSNVYQLIVPNQIKKRISVNVNRLKKYNGEWNKPTDLEKPDGIVEDELLNEENFTINDLPESSFIEELVADDEEKMLRNVDMVIKSIVAERYIIKSNKKKKQYLLLLGDDSYIWKNSSDIGSYRYLINEFEQKNRENKDGKKLRRSARIRDLDLEAGLSRTYYD